MTKTATYHSVLLRFLSLLTLSPLRLNLMSSSVITDLNWNSNSSDHTQLKHNSPPASIDTSWNDPIRQSYIWCEHYPRLLTCKCSPVLDQCIHCTWRSTALKTSDPTVIMSFRFKVLKYWCTDDQDYGSSSSGFSGKYLWRKKVCDHWAMMHVFLVPCEMVGPVEQCWRSGESAVW